jgi:hypothetical protein
MKKVLSLLVAALFLTAIAPLALAEEEAEEPAGGEETTTEEGGGEEGEAADPWSVPEAAEKAEEEEKAAEEEPEIVSPTGYPTAEIDRPLALPPMTLEPFVKMHFDIIEPDNWIGLRMGTGFGILDNIEAGIEFPLSFSPEFKAGDLQLYGLYDLGKMMGDALFVAGRLTAIIPLADLHLNQWFGSAFVILADAPVKFRFHDMFAAVGGVGLGYSIGRDMGAFEVPNFFLLFFDAGVLVQPMEELAVTLLFGVHAYIGDDSDSVIPMKFRGQYSMMGDVDLFLELGFMNLEDGADWVQLLFGAAYRLGL